MKILCIGHAAYDITFPLDSFPVENTKNRVNGKVECGGGPSNNAAYLLGKWGMDVTFLGIVGKDLYGDKIIEELKQIGIETKYMEQSEEHQTTSSIIIANTSKGSRTILTYRPKTMKMKPVELNFEPDIILIDGQEVELSKEMIKKYPNAISIIDAGRSTDEIIELCGIVNYVACSKEFAENVTNKKMDYEKPNTLIEIYQELENKFKNNIVITLESKGSLYKDGQIKMMPSIKVTAKDSTGAGDIFHGAFTYGIAKKWPIEKIVKVANVAGGISVTRIGSKSSMPTKEEMKSIVHDFE